MAAACYPYGDNTEALELAGDFLAWISEFDEKRVEDPASQGQPSIAAQNLLHSHHIVDSPDLLPAGLGSPFHLALRDLWLRLRRIASDQQLARMHAGWTEYAAGAACEIPYRAQRKLPDPVAYQAIRRRTVAFRVWFFVFIELVGGYELPAPLVALPELRQLATLANDITGLNHDIVTCEHDIRLPIAMNLPSVLAHHHGWPLQRGVDTAAEMYRATVEEFTRIADRLREEHSELAVHISRVAECISGFFFWENQMTSRYQA
ncbi:terpene synthase family protein [Streptomyces sp. CB02959]|uniref:terpene synthase family protein n=1 Tax=Streptomyces sp. CB02959 TaxID=2020330 RepID=UPI0035B5114D